MKKENLKDPSNDEEIEMRDEYDFDYSKCARGKYYRQATEENGYIRLSPEAQKIFKTSEDVNKALLAIISSMPSSQSRRKISRLSV